MGTSSKGIYKLVEILQKTKKNKKSEQKMFKKIIGIRISRKKKKRI